ncbi:MAG: hypothetical protein ACE5IW_00505 [bacterium]
MDNVDLVIKKLEKIENEINALKFSLKQSQKPLKLGGIWTRIDITENDIEEAKRSLFKSKLTKDI